jgi:tetratricopeptide (TPR) repeat protein
VISPSKTWAVVLVSTRPVVERTNSIVICFVALGVACAGTPPPPAAPAVNEQPALAVPPPEPDAAADWLRRGAALVKLGEMGTHEAWEQAKEALTQCVARDPGLAECQFLLGEACEFTDDETCAARSYTTAIVESPSSPDYYPPLAATYLRFKLYDQAEQVLHEGLRRVPRELANAANVLSLYRMQARVAAQRGDADGRVKALEAGAREGGRDPELDFELGTAYLDVEPRRDVDAVRAFARFDERVCRTSAAPFYKLECALAASLVTPLALGNAAHEPAPAAEEAPPLLTLAPPTEPVLLPPVPALPTRPFKDGDAFTVWGISHALRSRAHRSEVVRQGDDRTITVTGYITRTNLPDAPKCAVHRPGRPESPGCPRPLPAFWLGDSLDAPPEECIRVLGWASNYAQIFEAIRAFDRRSPSQYIDGFWGVALPNPLPVAGAKVTVRATYGTLFGIATPVLEADPEMGILTYQSYKVLEPAPELGTLPGVTRKPLAPR